MSAEEFVHHYHSKAVGWLELRGIRQGCAFDILYFQPPQSSQIDPSSRYGELISELDQYFAGKPIHLSVPLDPESGTLFQRRVWEQLTLIPYGKTSSYLDIARGVDYPKGSRAVGLANKHKSDPYSIPCHRVIKVGRQSWVDIVQESK